MGILDRLRRKKKYRDFDINEPMPTSTSAAPAQLAYPAQPAAPAVPRATAPESLKAQMDLVMSQMENLRIQYEAIDSRLQNMERVIKEIRSFCK